MDLKVVVEGYQEQVIRMRGEVGAIAREAQLTRQAVAEVDKHLRDERALFVRLGGALAQVFDRLAAAAGGEVGPAERDLERAVGEMLTMGKWRGEEMLRKISPLGRAAVAVQEAARQAEVRRAAGLRGETNPPPAAHTCAYTILRTQCAHASVRWLLYDTPCQAKAAGVMARDRALGGCFGFALHLGGVPAQRAISCAVVRGTDAR